jgi:hypothetical protein
MHSQPTHKEQTEQISSCIASPRQKLRSKQRQDTVNAFDPAEIGSCTVDATPASIPTVQGKATFAALSDGYHKQLKLRLADISPHRKPMSAKESRHTFVI